MTYFFRVYSREKALLLLPRDGLIDTMGGRETVRSLGCAVLGMGWGCKAEGGHPEGGPGAPAHPHCIIKRRGSGSPGCGPGASTTPPQMGTFT